MKVAQEWCKYSTRTFAPHTEFAQNLLNLCDFKDDLCLYAFECIETLLRVNKFAKILKFMTSITNFSAMSEKDQEYLRQVIVKLHCNRDDYDDDSEAANSFRWLISTLCTYYEAIMINES